MMIIKLMITMVSMTPLMTNPMQMGINLLMQTMLTTLFINKILPSSWFSLITFMMMIGGLLILFNYMSSIASNEKVNLKINLSLIMMIMFMPMDEMFTSQTNFMESSITSIENMSLSKMFNNKTMYISMFMIFYLLLAMIMVSKMIKTYKGPLRSKYE
uniref:NADH dehydrogenase subunit 6 n=1 Tax=Cladolidia biungulata TaxID=2983421 RepID=A0A977TLG1_9HEMI|nr:NADH dehydrogenase subunit 6 [Cladolidia biungulata]UXW93604.1 NADH dehydrogenase subunit 6 [Cladolidia biungulata]